MFVCALRVQQFLCDIKHLAVGGFHCRLNPFAFGVSPAPFLGSSCSPLQLKTSTNVQRSVHEAAGQPQAHGHRCHPFPGALTCGTPTAGRTPSAGGGGCGEAWAGDQNGQGNGDGSPMSTHRDGESGEGGAGAAGCNRTTEVRRPYRCSKCGAEKKGHLCSAKLAANMMPATPVKRVDLAARLAARLHAANGEGGEGMEEGRGALQPNDLSNLPFSRSFRARKCMEMPL